MLSACGWNVCIEIKPVDRVRGYSATSLTSTLREQLVARYLKGFNSSHGILLLFQLDNKGWEINGKVHPLPALVEYLQAQAGLIKAEHPRVQELKVFLIDCTLPGAAVKTSATASKSPGKRAVANRAAGTNIKSARKTTPEKVPQSKKAAVGKKGGRQAAAVKNVAA